MKVNPQHIMALRRLTDQPISACREALVEAGGDLVAVVRKLQWSPCCGIYATDAELAAVLAEYGVAYTPEVREPVLLPDAEVVAELTACGAAMSDYFLIEGLVCSINARGELMGCSIDDEDLAASATAYLRRVTAAKAPFVAVGKAVGEAFPVQRVGLVAFGFGLVVAVSCLMLPQTAAAIVGGVGATFTAVSVQTGFWLKKAARRVGLMS